MSQSILPKDCIVGLRRCISNLYTIRGNMCVGMVIGPSAFDINRSVVNCGYHVGSRILFKCSIAFSLPQAEKDILSRVLCVLVASKAKPKKISDATSLRLE